MDSTINSALGKLPLGTKKKIVANSGAVNRCVNIENNENLSFAPPPLECVNNVTTSVKETPISPSAQEGRIHLLLRMLTRYQDTDWLIPQFYLLSLVNCCDLYVNKIC